MTPGRSIPLLLVAVAGMLAGCHKEREGRLMGPGLQQYQPAQEQPELPRAPYTDISVMAQDHRIPVLMFHDVIAERGRGSVWFDCSAEEFETMMQRFKSENIQPISLDQLYDHLTKGAPTPAKAIVLTFDDNYQGFYDNALPILKKYGYPAAMFVHTNYVGDKTHGRPKMDWPTLKELSKGTLVTIGSHTLSHPDDITKIPEADQVREITESKKVLEDQLGKPVPYFAYPDGKNDAATQAIVKQAGYKMAVTMHNGPSEESPNIFAIDRYVHTKLDKALETAQDAADNAPAAVVDMSLRDAPLTYETGKYAGVQMAFIKGGAPASRRSPSRQGVLEFMHDAGASAGINGTFFAMAAISGTSNEMVGPCFTSNERVWVPDLNHDRLDKIRNRPMVVWGPRKFGIFPFQGDQMNAEDPIRNFMPDFTDAFVAGAWVVHDGVARTRDQMEAFSARDMMDPRRRAFFGIMRDGSIVLGASLGSVGTDKLAEAAAAAGVKEALMMDSGFSTSLVYGDKVVASGHSTPTTPSRPVPHAIVLTGSLATDPNAIAIPQPEPEKPRKRKKRKTRKEKTDVQVPAAPDISVSASPVPPAAPDQ